MLTNKELGEYLKKINASLITNEIYCKIIVTYRREK